MEANREHQIAAEAIRLYIGNRRPVEIIDALFDHPLHPVYLQEWLDRWRSGFGAFFGYLDAAKRWRFVEEAIAAYGDEAARTLR